MPSLQAMPCASPMPAGLFAEHLPLAVDAAHRHGNPLALVVLRAIVSGRRGRARLHWALGEVEGFSYELQPGGYAVLMPGGSSWAAFHAALTIRSDARGGVLRPGATVDAGLAALEPGMSASGLFAAAAAALYDAETGRRSSAVRTGAGAAPTHVD
jgi:hypothetical protein